MAEKKFSELPSAASLTGNELAALSQMQSGSLASVKSTLQAIANWFAVYAQYTTALQTTDKSIAGAINELKRQIALIPGFDIVKVNSLPTEDIDTHTLYLVPSQDPEAQNSCDEYINTDGTTAGWELIGSTDIDLSDYYTKLEVDGLLEDKLEADDFEANQTASANPITLETKQAGLAKSCVVEMNPIQDLNGYPNPWVGGAGKNKFQTTATSSGDFTVNSDGTVTVNGSFSGTSQFTVGTFDFKANTQYKLVGCPSGGGGSSYALYARGTEDFNQQVDQGNGVTFTPATDVTTEIRVIIYSGYTASNVLFKPMISTDTSVTYATFAPYSNICPISGRTEASVTRTGANLYGGSVFKDEVVEQVPTATVTSNTVAFGAGAIGNKIFATGVLYKPNTAYTFRMKCQNSLANTNTNLRVYYTDRTYIEFRDSSQGQANVDRNIVITTDANKTVQELRGVNQAGTVTVYLDSFGVFEGTRTFDDFEPYNGKIITIQFGQTIYGALLDAQSGKMAIIWILFNPTQVSTVGGGSGSTPYFLKINIPTASKGKNTVNDNSQPISSAFFTDKNSNHAIGGCFITSDGSSLHVTLPDQTVDDLQKAQTYLNNHTNEFQFAYKLLNPVEIQLSPEALQLLSGVNVISTDGDKVRVEFSDIPVGDYSVLLGYIKSLEARIAAVEP